MMYNAIVLLIACTTIDALRLQGQQQQEFSGLVDTEKPVIINGKDWTETGIHDESEEKCELVSIYGMLKSCDVFEEKWFSSINASKYVETMQRKGAGVVVFVYTTALPAFVRDVLPKVTQSFVLVTGGSDKEPEAVLGAGFLPLVNDARLLRMFAQNTLTQHDKLVQIPIGLDYHLLSTDRKFAWGNKASPKEQERDLLQIRAEAPTFDGRKPSIFSDHFTISHPSRKQVLTSLGKSQNVDLLDHPVPRTEMWKQMAEHRFVASPRGRGVDTYRTWEALALGSVPLVSAGPHNKIFKDHGLPVVEMDEAAWGTMDSEKIKAAMASAMGQKNNEMHPALTLKYWVSKFRDA